MMSNSVSAAKKKGFIEWFLSRYKLQKNEAIWLLSYLSSSQQILRKVHFVKHFCHTYPKSIIVSTTCCKMASFQFVKNKHIGSDVESAFYDIWSYPNEDLYIALYFKDRDTCPNYTAVLEGNPMEEQDLVQEHLISLFAELLLDNAVQEFKKQELYKQIDDALAIRDKQRFLYLSKQLKEM
jgi:uncharacterized protein YpiB (UPF0302 family)